LGKAQERPQNPSRLGTNLIVSNAEGAEDSEEAKVSLCVSDLALFQFPNFFWVAKAGLEGGKSSMKFFAGNKNFGYSNAEGAENAEEEQVVTLAADERRFTLI